MEYSVVALRAKTRRDLWSKCFTKMSTRGGMEGSWVFTKHSLCPRLKKVALPLIICISTNQVLALFLLEMELVIMGSRKSRSNVAGMVIHLPEVQP